MTPPDHSDQLRHARPADPLPATAGGATGGACVDRDGSPGILGRMSAVAGRLSTFHLLVTGYALAGFLIAAWTSWRITHADLLPDAAITGRWAVFDWLTTYDGGFVRRGLSGEIISRLSEITGIAPQEFVFGILVLLYAALGVLMLGLIAKLPDATPALLLLFAPFMLGFEVLTPSGVGRKEILFIAVLAALAFLHARRKSSATSLAPEITLAALPFMVLTHEAFFLFSPYVLVFGLLQPCKTTRHVRLFGLWMISAAAFGAAVLNHGSADVVMSICDALAPRTESMASTRRAWAAERSHRLARAPTTPCGISGKPMRRKRSLRRRRFSC